MSVGILTPPSKVIYLNCCFIGFPPSRVLSEILRSLTNSACIILLHPLLCYFVFECLSSCSTYLLKACWAVTFNIPELFNPTLEIPLLFYVFHQTMERFMMCLLKINWNTLNFLASTLIAKTTLQCLIIQSAEFTRSSKLQLRTAEHLSKTNIAEDSWSVLSFWWQNVWIHGSLHLSD